MNLTCYIVDDEPSSIRIITRYIERIDGLELIGSAQNPVTAVEEIFKLKPNLVISDINMPEMSGVSLAEKISDFTQIILMSAEPQQRLNLIDWKDYHFLPKPVSFSHFTLVTEAIRSKQQGLS